MQKGKFMLVESFHFIHLQFGRNTSGTNTNAPFRSNNLDCDLQFLWIVPQLTFDNFLLCCCFLFSELISKASVFMTMYVKITKARNGDSHERSDPA